MVVKLLAWFQRKTKKNEDLLLSSSNQQIDWKLFKFETIRHINKVMALTFEAMMLNRTWFFLIIWPEDILV